MTKDRLLSWAVQNVKVWPEGHVVATPNTPTGAAWAWSGGEFRPQALANDGATIKDAVTRDEWEAASAACGEFQPFVSAEDAQPAGKPGWDDTPEWAQWLSQNCKGCWTFTENEQTPNNFGGWSAIGDQGRRAYDNSKWVSAVVGDWRDTLEKRPSTTSTPVPTTASYILQQGVDALSNRAAERDQADGERSMARCVKAFNVMFGHQITEEQGWQFMELLKMARAAGGAYREDDYVDGAAYAALAGEAAAKVRGAQ